MKTVKAYICKCGENIFEDDIRCINCGIKVDKRKLKKEEIADNFEITQIKPKKKHTFYSTQDQIFNKGYNQACDEWEKYHKEVIQFVIKEIEEEIDSRPQYPNIGKKGCIRRLKRILRAKVLSKRLGEK